MRHDLRMVLQVCFKRRCASLLDTDDVGVRAVPFQRWVAARHARILDVLRVEWIHRKPMRWRTQSMISLDSRNAHRSNSRYSPLLCRKIFLLSGLACHLQICLLGPADLHTKRRKKLVQTRVVRPEEGLEILASLSTHGVIVRAHVHILDFLPPSFAQIIWREIKKVQHAVVRALLVFFVGLRLHDKYVIHHLVRPKVIPQHSKPLPELNVVEAHGQVAIV